MNDDDDEEDTEGEGAGEKANTDDEDDEAALLDKVLKDCFLRKLSLIRSGLRLLTITEHLSIDL